MTANNRPKRFWTAASQWYRGAYNRSAWLKRLELSVLLGLFAVVASTWMFVELADEVLEGDTQQFDKWVHDQLRDPLDPARPRGPKWFVDAARDITALGSVTVLTLLTLLVAGDLYLRRQRRAMWLTLAAVVSGVLLSVALKHYFDRGRPEPASEVAWVTSSSFPSGHAAMSAIVYLTLGALLARMERRWRFKVYALAVALLLTFAVGVSRVILLVHYPTDVLAGWTVGLGWAVLWWLIARSLQQQGAVEPSNAGGVVRGPADK